jgi:hypothetical protein
MAAFPRKRAVLLISAGVTASGGALLGLDTHTLLAVTLVGAGLSGLSWGNVIGRPHASPAVIPAPSRSSSPSSR